MNAELFITNIGFVFSISVCLGLGILVFIRRPKGASSNVVFFLASIATGIWQISYVIGINLHDPRASQIAFMFNLATLFLVVLYTHLILSVTGRAQSHKRILTNFYIHTTGPPLIFSFREAYMPYRTLSFSLSLSIFYSNYTSRTIKRIIEREIS